MITANSSTGEIVVTRGDDQSISFQARDFTGASVNVATGSFTFTVKRSIDDAIGAAVFQRTSPASSGIDLSQAAAGLVVVNLTPANTTNLAGQYVYDLQMILSGNTRTLRTGVFRVRKETTHP